MADTEDPQLVADIFTGVSALIRTVHEDEPKTLARFREPNSWALRLDKATATYYATWTADGTLIVDPIPSDVVAQAVALLRNIRALRRPTLPN